MNIHKIFKYALILSMIVAGMAYIPMLSQYLPGFLTSSNLNLAYGIILITGGIEIAYKKID